nr:Gag-Pol polyprotein [Tanacetum cinerariifolium]
MAAGRDDDMEKMSVEQLKAIKEQTDMEVDLQYNLTLNQRRLVIDICEGVWKCVSRISVTTQVLRSHIRYALTHHPPIVFDSLVKQFWATATVRTLEAGPSEIIATIAGNEVVVTESLIRIQLQLNDANGLYEFTLHDVLDGMREIGTYNFSRFILDGMIGNVGSKRHKFLMYLRFLQMILVGPAGGDGTDAVAAGATAANEVSPPSPPPAVPPTHTSSSTPGPSPAAHDTPEVGPTTSTRPPSPTRQTSFQKDISEGGGDYVSSPKSNEAPPTTAATAAGGAEDSAALTDLSLKLDRCINRVTTLENDLGVTKKVLGGAVLKLVSRVKRLEGLLQQRKRRLVLSDSEGEEAATKEQDIDLDALHKLASTSLGGDTTIEAAYTIYKASQDAHASSDAGHDEDEVPDDTTIPFRRTRTKRRRLKKTVTSSTFKHFQEHIFAVEDTIPAGDGIPADAQTIPTGTTPIPSSGGVSAGSSMDPVGQATAAAPSSTIPAANKGKALMLGEDLAKKLHAEQEAEFARQQEELAQKAQAESVASPAEQGTGLSAQRQRELDAAQLIYTGADWMELMAKIATNSALSKQLLGDDVNEDNMNERLGMLFMRKRRELAERSRVKPMNKTQQRDFMRDFVKNQSASVYNQGWTMKQRTTFRPTPTLETPSAKRTRQGVPQDVYAASLQVSASVPVAPSTAAAVSVPAAPSIAADVLVSAAPYVHADTQTAFEHVSAEHTVDASTPSSSRSRHKQIAKKRVTPIVDVADDALIKFDSASDSDDDPLPYAPYADWEMVPTPLGSIHAYYDMEEHTKHFTFLRELLHMVEKNDLRKLLSAVDNFYHRHEPDTFALILWGDLCLAFISSCSGSCVGDCGWMGHLHVCRCFLSSQCRYFEAYAEAWVGSPKDAGLRRFDHGRAVELASPEQTATGKDVSNPFMAVMVCQKPLGYFSSPMIHVPRDGQMMMFHDPAVFGVPAGCSCWFSHSCWFLVAVVWLFVAVLFRSCCWNNDAILELTSEDLSRILKLTLSNSRLGEDFEDFQVSAPFFVIRSMQRQVKVEIVASFLDHVSFDPTPECQRMALEHDSLILGIQCQDNVPQADRKVTMSKEPDLLFSPMFDELLNGSSKVVSKSSAVSSADAPNQHHPLEQVIGNPSQSVRTRRQLESDGEMCMFALTMSRTEPKNIKEVMADSAWIESMQEELHQFD